MKSCLSFLIAFCLSQFFAPVSHAQWVYFSTDQAKLWRYNLDKQTAEMIGPILSENTPQTMLDIAFSPDGELYGISLNSKMYKIDRLTGNAVQVGSSTPLWSAGLTFSPDGTLWSAGSGMSYGAALFMVDKTTAQPTYVSTLPVGPSGDIAFNPVAEPGTQLHHLFMSSPGTGPDILYEVDVNTGVQTPRGNFGVWNVYGIDFTGDGDNLIGMSGDRMLIDMKRSGNDWMPTLHPLPTSMGTCYGASKYHCKTEAKPTLDASTATPTEHQCGNDLILRADESLNSAHYRWVVRGKDVNGFDQQETIEGDGTPAAINLQQDPRFLKFQFKKSLNHQPRYFTAELTTWCDTYEKSSTKSIDFQINPIPLAWEVRESSTGNAIAASFPYGVSTDFVDTGTEYWGSADWAINQRPAGVGKSMTHVWEMKELGTNTITYHVNHSNGCEGTETRSLEILDNTVSLPNSFTPNGDGMNDVFRLIAPPGSLLSHVQMVVQNRWGQTVFQGEGGSANAVAWDGTQNGTPVELGTYYYQIQYQMGVSSELHTKKGDVTLLR